MARDGEKPPKDGRRRRKTTKVGKTGKRSGQKRRSGDASTPTHRTAPAPSRISKPKGKPSASGPVSPSKATRKRRKKTSSSRAAQKKKKSSGSSRRVAGRTPRTPGLSRTLPETPQSIAPDVQKQVDGFLLRALDQARRALDAMERESRESAPRDKKYAQARRAIFDEAASRLRTLRDEVRRRKKNLEPEDDE